MLVTKMANRKEKNTDLKIQISTLKEKARLIRKTRGLKSPPKTLILVALQTSA